MKAKGLLFILAALLCLTGITASAAEENWIDFAQEVPLTDEAGNPSSSGKYYLISTPEQLAWIAQQVNTGAGGNTMLNATIRLCNDIDLSGKEWTPIGNGSYYFSSKFDGNGKIIQNITISQLQNGVTNYGLFGIVTGQVYDLGVTGSVSGQGNVGSITGALRNPGKIYNCYSSAAVSRHAGATYGTYTGGLVGHVSSTASSDYQKQISYPAIVNCYYTGTVSGGGSGSSGGIAGYVNMNSGCKGVIDSCYSSGVIDEDTKGAIFGGIINQNAADNFSVTNCFYQVQEGLKATGASYTFTTLEAEPVEQGQWGDVVTALNTQTQVKNDLQNLTSYKISTPYAVWGRDDDVNNGYPVLLSVGEGSQIKMSTTDGVISLVKGQEDGVFQVVLTPEDTTKVIERLVSGEFTLSLEQEEGAVSMEVQPGDGLILTQEDSYLVYVPLETGASPISGSEIVLAHIRLTGVGSGNLHLSGAKAEVKSEEDALAVSLNLINGEQTLTQAYELTAPTGILNVSVYFPNEAAGQKAVYNQMKVSAKSSDGSLTEISLGTDTGGTCYYVEKSDDTPAYYRVILNSIPVGRCEITVSGEGYRTFRQSVMVEEDYMTNVSVWNNVKDKPDVVVDGKEDTAQRATFLAGDIVMDQVINIYDLSAVVSYFGQENIDTQTSSEYARYDLNRDGKIDSKDVAMVLVSWEE